MSKDKQAKKQVMEDYKKALTALRAYRCDSDDDPKYQRLYAAATKAEKKVSWWKTGWF